MSDSRKMALPLFHRNISLLPLAANFSVIKSGGAAPRSLHALQLPSSPLSPLSTTTLPSSCCPCTMPLPTSWFHRLRRKRSTARGDASDVEAATKTAPMAGALPPCSPNRASYYFPSRERRAAADNPKVRDTRFPRSPQPSDIVFDVVAVSSAADRFDGMKEMPELRLRPILTKRAAKKGGDGDEALDSGTSAAASPTACRARRFHARPASGRRKGRVAPAALPADATARRRRPRRRCRWLYESLLVVKESADPEEDFLESMAEMIAVNDVRSPRDLEELLACYLALNAAEHHRAIVGAFRRAWLHTATATATIANPITTK
ncbi:transcription repressor OFP1-like [Oryza brachyantha]|uniref:transcription repressor OFP1-like n=1 Tax=Oryza brachyantha TaxID=4533 RepID=UPI001ADBE059|nr:transcription repressor OFP1-like [Oryza brachyantha]